MKRRFDEKALHQKFVLCITDAFAKYTVVTAITNSEIVADAIYKEWFSKFGIPAQIHTDGGKEFVNKLSAEIFQIHNVSRTWLIHNAMYTTTNKLRYLYTSMNSLQLSIL